MATFPTEIEIRITGNVGSKLSSLSSKLGNFSRRINRATASLTRMGSRLESAGNKMSFLGTRLTAGLTLPLAALGIGALRASARLEALQRGLQAVMGSTTAAAAEFVKLRVVARLPGLGLTEAVRGSLALQSAGFSADSARRALLAFGNAAALAGRGKDAVAGAILAVTQLVQKSSGFGQDLRQLVERLPQVRGALKAAFGTASTDEITGFGVSGADIVAALIENFEKLPPLTTGLFNAFENLGDSVEIALGDPKTGLGSEIDRLFSVTANLDRMGAFVEKLAARFAGLSTGVKKFIIIGAAMAASIGPTVFIFGALVASVGAVISLLAPLGLAIIPIAIGVGVILAGVTALGLVISRNFGAFKSGFLDVWSRARIIALPILKEIKFNLKGIFSETKTAFRDVFGAGGFNNFATLFKDDVLDGFKDLLELLNAIVKVIRVITPAVAKVTAVATKNFLENSLVSSTTSSLPGIGLIGSLIDLVGGDSKTGATTSRSNQLFGSANNTNNNVNIFLQEGDDKKISVRKVSGDGKTNVKMSTGSMLPQGA